MKGTTLKIEPELTAQAAALFAELGMEAIWCGYYTGNEKSKRVQEKLGFVPHHLRRSAPVPLLGETRDEQINVLTKARWAALCEK